MRLIFVYFKTYHKVKHKGIFTCFPQLKHYKENHSISSQIFCALGLSNMDNPNVQNPTSVSPVAEFTFSGTYAEVLTKGKSTLPSSVEDTSNNNPIETKSTANGSLLNIAEESDLNSAETSTFVTADSSRSNSFEGTDDSRILMESSAEQISNRTEEVCSESHVSRLSGETEDDAESSEKEADASECSGEYSGSDEESDTDEAAEIDELYPAALKWKFRTLNPVPSLPDTVTVLKTERGSTVFLVGTAHFSTESQDDVAKTIKAVQPDIVMIELCKSRVNILSLDEATILEESKNMNLQKVRAAVEQNGVLQGILYLLLLSMSAHLTKQLGMAPGGEFRRAFNEAKQVPGCLVHLGDRPIHITMQRALARLSLWQKIRIAWYMLRSKEPISKEEVERCKQKDLLEKMLAEMTGEFPELSRVFVKERDIYLTYSLQMSSESLPSPHCPENVPTYVVGIVGIGHVPGIKEMWGKVTEEDVQEILSIPEPSLSSKVIRQTLRISLLGLGIYAVYRWFPTSLVPKSVGKIIAVPYDLIKAKTL